MEVDFKITTWERVTIDDDSKLEEIKTKLEDKTIQTSNDLIAYCESNNIDVSFEGTVFEAEEQITTEENSGCATIEVLVTKGSSIGTVWTNEPK